MCVCVWALLHGVWLALCVMHLCVHSGGASAVTGPMQVVNVSTLSDSLSVSQFANISG